MRVFSRKNLFVISHLFQMTYILVHEYHYFDIKLVL